MEDKPTNNNGDEPNPIPNTNGYHKEDLAEKNVSRRKRNRRLRKNRRRSSVKNRGETSNGHPNGHLNGYSNGNRPQSGGSNGNTKMAIVPYGQIKREEIELDFMAPYFDMNILINQLVQMILNYSVRRIDVEYIFPVLIEQLMIMKTKHHLVPLMNVGSRPMLPIMIPEKYGKILTDSLLQPNNIPIRSAFYANGLYHISFKTIDLFKDVWRLLRMGDIPFHFFDPRDKKVIKLVIKGIPSNVSPKKILAHLLLYFPVKCVHRMTRGPNKIPLPFLLVHVHRSPRTVDMYNITNILGFNVRVESLKKSEHPTQCFRCQGFFHAARWCHAPVKCVRCAGDHWSRNCKFSKDDHTKVLCVNCGGLHTANYKLCPIFHKNTQHFKYLSLTRVPTDMQGSHSRSQSPFEL